MKIEANKYYLTESGLCALVTKIDEKYDVAEGFVYRTASNKRELFFDEQIVPTEWELSTGADVDAFYSGLFDLVDVWNYDLILNKIYLLENGAKVRLLRLIDSLESGVLIFEGKHQLAPKDPGSDLRCIDWWDDKGIPTQKGRVEEGLKIVLDSVPGSSAAKFPSSAFVNGEEIKQEPIPFKIEVGELYTTNNDYVLKAVKFEGEEYDLPWRMEVVGRIDVDGSYVNIKPRTRFLLYSAQGLYHTKDAGRIHNLTLKAKFQQ